MAGPSSPSCLWSERPERKEANQFQEENLKIFRKIRRKKAVQVEAAKRLKAG